MRGNQGSRARLGSSITQSPGQQLDVLLLVSGDLVDPSPSPVGEPGVDKVLVGELVEVLSVKGGLEVFEGPTGRVGKSDTASVTRDRHGKGDEGGSQGVLQDGDIGHGALPLFNSGGSGGDEAERDGGGDGGDGELHYELESKGCLVGKTSVGGASMSMLESEELMEWRERESTMERECNGRAFVQTIYCT